MESSAFPVSLACSTARSGIRGPTTAAYLGRNTVFNCKLTAVLVRSTIRLSSLRWWRTVSALVVPFGGYVVRTEPQVALALSARTLPSLGLVPAFNESPSKTHRTYAFTNAALGVSF